VEIVRTVREMRERLAPRRRRGQTVGFVPTLGYLHEGHLTLLRRARAECDVVVASIYVNPIQFLAGEDFDAYPRDLERGARLVATVPADYIFAPPDSEMYPRPQETFVDVPSLTGLLEGGVRPGHFRAIATVVAKLLGIVQPDRAYFGEKDYQQLLMVKRMVADLDMPIEVVGVPTVREADGVACSSRNVYLSQAERRAAVRLNQALSEARRLVAAGERDTAALREEVRAFIAAEPLARPEVVAVCGADDLRDAAGPLPPRLVVLLFVRFGATQLLDHSVIELPDGPGRG